MTNSPLIARVSGIYEYPRIWGRKRPINPTTSPPTAGLRASGSFGRLWKNLSDACMVRVKEIDTNPAAIPMAA